MHTTKAPLLRSVCSLHLVPISFTPFLLISETILLKFSEKRKGFLLLFFYKTLQLERETVKDQKHPQKTYTYLYKAVNTPDVSGTSAFTDLTDRKDTEKDAILWAEQNHIFDGLADDFFTEDAFDAEKDITREEAAVMLYNVAEHVLNIDMTKDVRENLSDFEDGDVVADDYVDAVLWAVGNDILTPGTTDEKADDYDEAIAGLLHLDKAITKVETAEAISRLLDLVEDENIVTAKTEYEDAQEAAHNENAASAPAPRGRSFTFLRVPKQKKLRNITKRGNFSC